MGLANERRCYIVMPPFIGCSHSQNDHCLMYRHHLALTHWGWVTHICVSNTTIIGSDNGLSPGRRQAINWTNDGILSIGPLGTNFSENLIEIDIWTVCSSAGQSKHQSSTSLNFVQGIHRWLVNSLHKGQWCRALMFSLICTWKCFHLLMSSCINVFVLYHFIVQKQC